MITIRTSQIQNTDRSRWPSNRHGGAQTNARLQSQLVHRSALLKADTSLRNGLFMRGNVVGRRTPDCRLPSRSSFAARKSP